MTNDSMNQEFERLTERLIGEHWDFYPTAGSRIGKHEYDGRLPDLSPAKIDSLVKTPRPPGAMGG